MTNPWYVYIVKANDNSLYTGITNNLAERINKHNFSNKGAKYLRGRRPVELVYTETYNTQTEARKRESVIKSFTRTNKLLLIGQNKL